VPFERCSIEEQSIEYCGSPIHNILSTAPELSISQKALETFLEDGIIMPKHVGLSYIINILKE
jgi:hypothetical protein